MEGHEAPKESRCSRLVVMDVLVVVVDGAWLWRDKQRYRLASHPDPRKILLTGFHTDDVQTLERTKTDRNDNKNYRICDNDEFSKSDRNNDTHHGNERPLT